MARPKKQRVPSVPITQSEYDGNFHGYLQVGNKPNGKPDVRHRSAPTFEECAQKILDLEDEVAARPITPAAGRSPLMSEYLRGWHAEGCKALRGRKPRWAYNTQVDYLQVIEDYLIPHLGGHRVDAFSRSSDHTKYMTDRVTELVSAHAAAKAYRVLRSAMSDAWRAGLVPHNVVKLIQEPVVEKRHDVEVPTDDEADRLLAVVMGLKRRRARWLHALTMGPRQGESLGLRWARPDQPRMPGDVDLEKGTIRVREKLLRKKWRHGCDDPHACGSAPRPGKPRGVHSVERAACPGSGPKHKRYHERGHGCPPAVKGCPATCKKHAAACPKRWGGGLHSEQTKTRAGVRTVPMPRPMWDAFIEEKALQDADRERAANLWADSGYCFTGELGKPLDPRADYDEWVAIEDEAQVPHIKLHATRHIASTVLGRLGVPKATRKKILGWATDMGHVYDHATDDDVRAAMRKVEKYWWKPDKKKEKGKKGKGKKKTSAGTIEAASSTDLSTDNVIQLRPKAPERTSDLRVGRQGLEP